MVGFGILGLSFPGWRVDVGLGWGRKGRWSIEGSFVIEKASVGLSSAICFRLMFSELDVACCDSVNHVLDAQVLIALHYKLRFT